MIGLREGKAEFRFDLGLGVGVVQSNQPLTIGENHMITVRRYVIVCIYVLIYNL